MHALMYMYISDIDGADMDDIDVTIDAISICAVAECLREMSGNRNHQDKAEKNKRRNDSQ